MIAVQPKNVMWPCMRNVLKAFFKPAHSRTQVHIQTHILSPLQLSWTSCCRPLPWHQCLLCMRESLGRVRRLWNFFWTVFEQFNIPCCGCMWTWIVGIDLFYKFLVEETGIWRCKYVYLTNLSVLPGHKTYILQMILGLLLVAYSDES